MQSRIPGSSRRWSTPRSVLLIATVSAFVVGGCSSGSDIHLQSAATMVRLSDVSALRGDLDGNGNPDVGDAIAILRIVVQLAPPNPLADCNGDGSPGVADAIMVLRCVVGLAQWPLGTLFPEPDRQISGVVAETDFVIAEDETVEAVGDTTIQCNTATISGDLFSQPAGAGGAAGASITVEATGDILVLGNIESAAGHRGDSVTPDGGDGGDILLRSSGGSVTIGTAQTAGVGLAEGGPPSIRSGDGADGVDGGAGGDGGGIYLEAPNGTVTVNQSTGLFAVGNGGDGGELVVGGNDLLTCELPEQLGSAGGDGGSVQFDAREFEGIEFIERGELSGGVRAYEATFGLGVVVRGAGGDAGAFYYGEDPQTGESTWPAGARMTARPVGATDEPQIRGADGGNGLSAAGDGQSLRITDTNTGAAGADGRSLEVSGGRGGNCGGWEMNGGIVYVGGSGSLVAGNGGDVRLLAANGNSGGPGQAGGAGGIAWAYGGRGGNVYIAPMANATAYPGRGGNAEGFGGTGGRGGNACSPPAAGGGGGRGGDANASGGWGGATVHVDGTIGSHGVGGNAQATAGSGGDGGDGAPAGAGGSPGGATADGGSGEPDGDAYQNPGASGGPGAICGSVTQKRYSAITYTTLNQEVVTIRSDALQVAVVPSQAGAVELGGEEHPFRVTGTQSIAATSDFSVLWGIHEYDKVHMYRTPLAGGDREPNVILTTTGTLPGHWMTSLWYDEVNDRLYCTHGTSISVWYNASQTQINHPANRTVTITGVPRLTNICGDATRDILFAITDDNGVDYGLICIDGIGTAQGTIAPSREVDAGNFGVGLAYNGISDRLYVGKHNPMNPAGTARVLVIGNASAASGVVTPHVLQGPLSGIDGYIVGLQAIAGDDALFVGCANASLLAYPFASTIVGDTQPQSAGQLAGNSFLVVPAG